ncbi:hypothetical protein ACOMHN_024659 [Nucella lapillus]
MRPWRRLSEVKDCILKTDNVMVNVYVQKNSMSPRGLSRTSRRSLLTISIWSVIVIVLVFFITYAILLVYVDRPFQKFHEEQVFPGNHNRPKVRLLGKGIRNGNKTVIHFSPERKIVWDPGLLDDPDSETPKCRQGSIFLIIVTTSPDHFEHRTAIRKTWCSFKMSSDKNGWQCLFLIGQTFQTNISEKINAESQRYGDIVSGSYVDSYQNLTLKVMHGLAWVNRHCQVPIVLKTDDDCFVNAALFKQFLLYYNTKTTHLYAGNLLMNKNRRKVIRNLDEKWSVPKDDYLPEYYPVYASGSGYALSSDVVTKLVEESRFKKPISNEDAYVGIVIDSLGILPTYSGRFTLSSAGLRVCNYLYVVLAHGVEPGMQEETQRKATAAQSECNNEEKTTGWL